MNTSSLAKVQLGDKVRTLIKNLPSESYIAFNNCLDRLEKQGSLHREGHLEGQYFTYSLETGEFIVFERLENRAIWGKEIHITITHLASAQEVKDMLISLTDNSLASAIIPTPKKSPISKTNFNFPNTTQIAIFFGGVILLTIIALHYGGMVEIRIGVKGGQVIIDSYR